MVAALGSQGQEELYKFKASLVYIVSSRTAKATRRNPVSKNHKKKKKRAWDNSNIADRTQTQANTQRNT